MSDILTRKEVDHLRDLRGKESAFYWALNTIERAVGVIELANGTCARILLNRNKSKVPKPCGECSACRNRRFLEEYDK